MTRRYANARRARRPDMGRLSVRPDPTEVLRAIRTCAAWLSAAALLAHFGYLYLRKGR